jgi:hypothetical protein
MEWHFVHSITLTFLLAGTSLEAGSSLLAGTTFLIVGSSLLALTILNHYVIALIFTNLINRSIASQNALPVRTACVLQLFFFTFTVSRCARQRAIFPSLRSPPFH